jgi:hypothetical protein
MSQLFAAAVPLHEPTHFIILKKGASKQKRRSREEVAEQLGLRPRGGLTSGFMAH